MTNNTINNVPRELKPVLAMILNALDRDAADGKQARAEMAAELRAILSAPPPAGVDGCRCSMSISVLGDGCRYCQPQEYIDRLSEMLDEERAELSDAQATIDGLRGELAVALKVPSVAAMHTYLDTECAKDNIRLGAERDQQAHRIGELEGLLREERTYASVPASCQQGVVGRCMCRNCRLLRIDAALSAGKEGE